MTILKRFDALMSHLNGEENGMAEEFRKDLAELVDSAAHDSTWISCLEAAGVDNWDGYSEAQDMMPDDDEEEDDAGN